MSAESGHNTIPPDAPPLLFESAVEIAFDFLRRSGEIDDYMEACHFLASNIGSMMTQGERNRLMLANRAITAYQRQREARRMKLELAS